MLSSVTGYVNEHLLTPDIFHYIAEHHIVCFIQQIPSIQSEIVLSDIGSGHPWWECYIFN